MADLIKGESTGWIIWFRGFKEVVPVSTNVVITVILLVFAVMEADIV